MLQFGLRLGGRPRQVVTTPPRPIPLLKRIIADPGTILSKARTHDNSKYLAAAFLKNIVARYEGTRLGRQELDAELIEERTDALWHRAAIEASRVGQAPALRRIVVAVDPPASPASMQMPAGWSPPGSARTAPAMCWKMRRRKGCRRRAGRSGRSTSITSWKPTASWRR
jgi:phage terminase large subunit-like protein